MSLTRNIRKVFRSKPVIEGAGVHLKYRGKFSFEAVLLEEEAYKSS